MARPQPAPWLRAHPTAADALLAAGVLALALAGLLAGGGDTTEVARDPDAGAVVLVLLQTLPLALRRRVPVTTFLLVTTAWVLTAMIGYPDNGAFLGPLIGAYSVGAWSTERRDLAVCGAGTALVAAGGTLVDRADTPLVTPVVVVGVLAIAFLIGATMRRRRERVAELEAETQRLTRERELEARHAVAEERARIARELHDVVAHSLSVMVVQAGAARRVVTTDPGAATDAIGAIERTGRDALGEMRRLLGVLRADTAADSGGLAPQPSLDRLDDLVDADPSLPVRIERDGEAVELPPSVEVSAFRIVQEALTNVRKHAGPAAATVTVRYGLDALVVEVTDDGRGAAAHPARTAPGAGGHGVAGMRERAALCGGDLHAGPRPGGGWRVAAVLPYAGTGTSVRAAAPATRAHREHLGVEVGGAPLRVLVADDQHLVRSGFRLIVDAEPDLSVVGEAADGEAAVAEAARTRPDVVLMDIRMPTLDGIEATARITSGSHPPKVLMLTTFDLDEYVVAALRAGASGFLLKDTPPEDLVAAVRVVAAGDALLTPSITRRVIEQYVRPAPRPGPSGPSAIDHLTERELEVLLLVARGRSNAEIAEDLVLGEATVKTHVGRILMKLGVRDRVQAVVAAYELGLVVPGGGDAAAS